MDERALGIIIRTRPLTESSLIVQWLTPDLGRISTVAKGARRTKSAFRGKLDLYYLAELSFHRSRRSDLHNLREVSLRETHSQLRVNLDYLHQLAYCCALIEQTTEQESPLPGPYHLLESLIQYLPQQPAQASTIFAFELKLLQDLGLSPDLKNSALPEGTRLILQRYIELPWESVANIKLAASQVSQISAYLNGFLLYHVDRVPKTRSKALLK